MAHMVLRFFHHSDLCSQFRKRYSLYIRCNPVALNTRIHNKLSCRIQISKASASDNLG